MAAPSTVTFGADHDYVAVPTTLTFGAGNNHAASPSTGTSGAHHDHTTFPSVGTSGADHDYVASPSTGTFGTPKYLDGWKVIAHRSANREYRFELISGSTTVDKSSVSRVATRSYVCMDCRE